MERPAQLRPTLGPLTSWRIQREALKIAKNEMGLEQGAVRVGGRHRLITLQGSFGDAAPLYKLLAKGKLRDVLISRRSGSIAKKRREQRGQKITDFGGVITTDIIGGVAIRDRRGRFLGGAAFSGGTPLQDEAIMQLAVQRVGLETDLPQEPQTQMNLVSSS